MRAIAIILVCLASNVLKIKALDDGVLEFRNVDMDRLQISQRTLLKVQKQKSVKNKLNKGMEEPSKFLPSDFPELNQKLKQKLILALQIFNGKPLTRRLYKAEFSSNIRSTESYEQQIEIVAALVDIGPWKIIKLTKKSESRVNCLITNGKLEADLVIVVAPGSGLYEQVTISKAACGLELPTKPPTSGQEYTKILNQCSQKSSLLAASINNKGKCQVLFGKNENVAVPVGSVFKLYVLGAIVEKVKSGEVAWNQKIPIKQKLFSLPSGITQNEKPGTKVTVRELAERMISISDNTATDHLIDLIGRDYIESILEMYGHSNSKLNIPFLTTREFFILKWGLTKKQREQYISSTVSGKRQILETTVASSELPEGLVIAFSDPVDVFNIEWFVSPLDQCRLLAKLDKDNVAREVIAGNPGVPFDKDQWDYVGFKGGSEPGVIVTSWLVQKGKNKYVVSAGMASNKEGIKEQSALVLGYFRDSFLDFRSKTD